MSDDLVARLSRLDACAVSDAMDRAGRTGAALGLGALSTGRRIAGRAVTVQLGPDDGRASKRHLCTAAVEASGPGSVIVVANNARTDAAGWGGILSLAAKTRGVEGVIIDGACRDVDESREFELPVYARVAVPVTARSRVIEYDWDTPVIISGVVVSPGDYVIADASGVVFVPQDRAEEIVCLGREDRRARAADGRRRARRQACVRGHGRLLRNHADGALMSAEILARIQALSCTDLSDAMDRLAIPCQCFGIMPLDRSFRLAGQAWTLRYGPVGQDAGTVGDYIDDLDEGQVVVLDNQGRLDATVWGDLLTSTASRRKIGGTVIDGVCRDVDRSIELHYPIFSRGNWMRTGKDRVRVEATQVPVSIGGVRVEPGDWLRGDGDGLVAAPAARIAEILEAAEDIHAAEEHIRAAIDAGQSLRQARKHWGYHSLQTRR